MVPEIRVHSRSANLRSPNFFGDIAPAVEQMHVHLAKRCAFGQMPRISSIGQMCCSQMCCAFAQMRRLVKCALHHDLLNYHSLARHLTLHIFTLLVVASLIFIYEFTVVEK